jgi:hypothetical protein
MLEGGVPDRGRRLLRFGTAMRTRTIPAIILVLNGAAARAEDFSGFYAGVNAGYAWGKGRDRSLAAPSVGPGVGLGRNGSGPDLPPSARDAAAAMQRSRQRVTGTTAIRSGRANGGTRANQFAHAIQDAAIGRMNRYPKVIASSQPPKRLSPHWNRSQT